MRMKLLATCLAAAALSPIASAQETCEQQQNQRVAGTLAGGGIGAVVGGAVAGRGAKTEGAILGAIVGGVFGNQVSKPKQDCAHAYGFYDSSGAWHANSVARTDAQGFYGARGEWVDGPPRGRYNDRHEWENANTGGAYDKDGRWVPPGVNGYYGPDNRWIGVDAGAGARGGPAYDDGGHHDDRGDPRDIADRIDRIRDSIDRAEADRDLNRRDARALRSRLQDISYRQVRMPHRNGHLYRADEANVQRQLDAVNEDIGRFSRR
jgi:hypothetical protein